MGKDKYSISELKKQRELEAQFNAAKLKSSKLAEGEAWRDCFTLFLRNSKKEGEKDKKNKKKRDKKESNESEEDESSYSQTGTKKKDNVMIKLL
jgi:hypothetical protein